MVMYLVVSSEVLININGIFSEVRIVFQIVKFLAIPISYQQCWSFQQGFWDLNLYFICWIICGAGKGVNRGDRFVTDWIRGE